MNESQNKEEKKKTKKDKIPLEHILYMKRMREQRK